MSETFDHLGVDVSKATLDCRLGKTHRQFPNHAKGFRLLADWIAQARRPLRVVCEATGPYHRELVLALQQAGIGVCVLNPRQVRDYAKSQEVCWPKPIRSTQLFWPTSAIASNPKSPACPRYLIRD